MNNKTARVCGVKTPAAAKAAISAAMTRRHYLGLTTMASMAAAFLPWAVCAAEKTRGREYHVCLNPQAVLQDPEFPAFLARAGIGCVWLAGFFYGHWPWPVETLTRARDALRRVGIDARIVNVPLGHPGDSLGAKDGSFPLTPPSHWHLGTSRDGKTYAGTSLHAPATEENVAGFRKLRGAGFSHFFLDDDFRLARGPGEIGGCFCEEHRLRFLRRTGFPAAAGRSCWMMCARAGLALCCGSGLTSPVMT